MSYNKANSHTSANITIPGRYTESYVIKDLKPWEEYSVFMQAFTQAGVGPKTAKLETPVKTMEDGKLGSTSKKVAQEQNKVQELL